MSSITPILAATFGFTALGAGGYAFLLAVKVSHLTRLYSHRNEGHLGAPIPISKHMLSRLIDVEMNRQADAVRVAVGLGLATVATAFAAWVMQ